MTLAQADVARLPWHPGMPPEYRNQIVIGDCTKLMRQLPDESIGVIITSPPYNVGLNYEGYDDNLSEPEFKRLNQFWLHEGYRVTRPSGRLYAVVSDNMLYWFMPLAEAQGWTYHMKLVWCKPNFAAGVGKIKGDWNYMTEDILLFHRDKRGKMQNTRQLDVNTHNWFVETVPQSQYKNGRHHPAQWPITLPLKILARTPGEPILDPFCGSASALIAAKKLGRDYIGFEISESVAAMARKRLAGTLSLPNSQMELMPE